MNHEKMLDELYGYTQKEYKGIEFTAEERKRYVQLVDTLHDNNVEIPFGIEI